MKKIALTGGGTAGHVTPNLALVPHLRADGWQVSYIGLANGIEQKLAKSSGVNFYPITSGKLRRYISWRNFTDVFKIIAGIALSLIILLRIRPTLVFSKGGYVSVPVAIAAYFLRIKVITHESDYSFGLATRIISHFAAQIWVAFAETRQSLPRAEHTSLPIRDELQLGEKTRGYELCGFKPERTTLMIVGGSLGSAQINKAVATILAELLKHFQIVHIVGAGNVGSLTHSRYCAFSYVDDDFKHLLKMADLIVSRAGANSIFEQLSLLIPMLLIPLAAGSRGDQIQNASYFAEKGYALVLPEKQLNGYNLLRKILELDEKKHEIRTKQSKNNMIESNAKFIERFNLAVSNT